jgi:hypothetical protein
MSNLRKAEYIAKYGEDAWEQVLERSQIYAKAHPEKGRNRQQRWVERNREQSRENSKKQREKYPEKVKAKNREMDRKGGKYYERKLEYDRRGLRKLRRRVRQKHAKQWRKYKDIIAPDSQIHHEWIDNTAEYRGIALVEATPHQYGVIDVIIILDGKITLLTEAKIIRRKEDGK